MATGQVNANDPRVKRTRHLLQETLLALLQEKNFTVITVQDIAERSTLNRATFYAHFEDKYDLLDSIMREGVQRALAGTVADTAPVTHETLQALCRTVCNYLGQLQDHCKPRDRQFEPMLEKAVQDVVHEFVLRWLRQAPPATLPGEASVETVATVLSWAIFGVASAWSGGVRSQSADEVGAQVASVLIEGIAALVVRDGTAQAQMLVAS